MFASSIAPPQSPQRRLDLPHRNRSTLTNSSDEAEANSAPPRRFCTHRCILSFIRSHGAASARYRADMASPSTVLLPATSSTASLPHVVASSAATSTTALAAAAPALARAAALFLLSVALLRCSCFRSCCCSALALGPLPGLLLLLLLLALLLSLLLLLAMLLRFGYTSVD